MEDLKSCIEFCNANPFCYLATVDDDQPRVRALGFWYADETGFYFQTGAIKKFPHELEKNPKAEACFYHHENPTGTMLRIAGSVEFLQDRELREKALRDRPFLKDLGFTVDSPGLVLFRMAHGQAHFWTMKNNAQPKNIIEF